MDMQDITGEIKRSECQNCGTQSSSMWETHKLMLVCLEDKE